MRNAEPATLALAYLAVLAGVTVAALTLSALPAVAAGDAAAGRKKIHMCQPCHGSDGISKLPEAPNLAGQTELYLAKSLNDYKSGVRKNEQMSVVAPGLSAEDVADFAAYYSSIEITVKAPK